MGMPDKTRVLILGGGFGGLYAALEFEKRNDPRFEVTVVNRENFFLFTPMLHEIAASDLDLTNIVNPVRKMIRRVNFFCGDVETIASINDFLRDALPFYPNLKEEMLRVVLIHPGEFILPELGEKLGRYADKKVRARGVEIFSKSKVAAVRPREIELSSGEKIISSTLDWTAGTAPNPILDLVACPTERG